MRALILIVVFATTIGRAETFLPTAPGTVWKYQMTQEFGAGVRITDPSIKPDADGTVRLPVALTVTGMEKIDNVEAYKLEWRRQGKVQTIQFLQVNEQGMFELARGDESGERIKLDPPQKILSFPLKVGEKWEYRGGGGGEKVEESYEIVSQESVEVPAGKFEAYHLRVIGTQPFDSVVDRWYVPGLGEIKDVTEVRRPNGAMVQRLSFELTETPKLAAKSEARSTITPAAKKLSIILAKDTTGEMTTKFNSDVSKLYARWQASDLAKGTKLRSVWIAEDVGEVAPPNYKVDETTVVTPAPPSSGTFSLSRPNAGWPIGSYRVEIYADDALIETLKFTIAQ
jgi:hypothetical protein